MTNQEKSTHNKREHDTIKPVYDAGSKILLLGTIPSPKSLEHGFYYSHPQNKLWRVLANVLCADLPRSADEKRALLLENHIAMWDVLHSCEIRGADDGSIRNPQPNELRLIFDSADIRAVFTTGSKACALYRRFFGDKFSAPHFPLPSTSPANCRYYTYDDLVTAYSAILAFLK